MEGKWNLADLCSPNIPQKTRTYIHALPQNLWEGLKSFSKLIGVNKICLLDKN